MASTPITSDTGFLRPPKPLRRDQVHDLLRLEKAARQIGSILDLDQLIDRVVNDIAISFGCVEANIYLRDEHRNDLILAGVHGCTTGHKGQRLQIGTQGMVGYVAGTRQMRYAPDVSKDPYYIVCEAATQSEVAIPLEVEGELVGVFTASHHDLDAFPPEQLRLLQSLCNHVAVAVHNAQRFKRERSEKDRMQREAQEARLIQEALLPKSSPYIPGYMVAGLSCPAGDVGGDWYDFIELDHGRWGLVLADVSGKGTAAALLMSATRGMLRSLAEACCTPAEVLTKLNRLMVEDFPTGRFVTLVYAVLDPAARTLTVANAGHLPPLLIDDTGARVVVTDSGMPLGLTFGNFSETTIHLPEQSRLLLYTDGITEAMNPADEEYGIERLTEQFSKPELSAEDLLASVREFCKPSIPRDDATLIVVRA